MYDPGADAPAKDVGVYEELTMFLKRTAERMEREVSEADQAEAHAKMARHRAEQTRRVYESTAKLHESMANAPAISPATMPSHPGTDGYSGPTRSWT